MLSVLAMLAAGEGAVTMLAFMLSLFVGVALLPPLPPLRPPPLSRVLLGTFGCERLDSIQRLTRRRCPCRRWSRGRSCADVHVCAGRNLRTARRCCRRGLASWIRGRFKLLHKPSNAISVAARRNNQLVPAVSNGCFGLLCTFISAAYFHLACFTPACCRWWRCSRPFSGSGRWRRWQWCSRRHVDGRF